MFLATQAGKEYVEAFWKAKYDSIIYFVIFSKLKQRYRAQKHKPKWVTPEVIEGGITITEVEICALWAPISLACGSGWFLDENLKARMVTFVPIMKKQTYWILARFIRALTLTKETDMDLSVETRQEIFLYSSKMDLFPAFPAPNGGYPRTPDEWMTVSPYYKSAMETDEMKAFMKRYGYKTTAIKLEEERAAKEAKMEQVRKEKEERERDKEVAIQKQREYQLQLACEKNVEGHGENAQVLCIEAAAVALAEDMVPRDDVTDDGVGFNINADAREVMAEAKIGVGTIDGAEVKVVGKAREQLGKTEGQASGVVEVFSSDADGGDESTPGASNTSADGDSEDYVSDEDDNPADFSTSMMVEANTQMTEDDYMNCQDEEATFFQKVQDIKEVLEFAGMRNWKDECLRALVLSGPIGICMWSMRLMSRLRHEIQRATVMLKQLDDATLAAQNKLKEEREQRRKDLEVWSKLQAQTHLHMDGLVQMRKEDLHSKGNAGDEISGGIFFGGGGAEASNGKRRSAYPDGRKSVYPDGQKRQKKAKSVMRNPFETPLRVGTPIGTQNVSTTIPKVGTPSDTPGERSDTMM